MGTLDKLFPPLWVLAFLSPVVAIFLAVRFYALHCLRRPKPGRRFPLVAYVLVLLVCEVIFRNQRGVLCPESGNLCGLFGFFVTGPFAASLAIFLVGGLVMLFPADEAVSIPSADAPIAGRDQRGAATLADSVKVIAAKTVVVC